MSYLKDLGTMLSWFEQAGVNSWNFCVLQGGMLGHERARGKDETLKCGGWGWVKNREGCDIYIRPSRGIDWPIIFLDDLSSQKAMRIAKKYSACVLETSPNNCHIWVATTSPASESDRLTIQRALAKKIGADPRSVGGEHFGRAPGFRNCKPGRNGFLVRVLLTTGGLRLDTSPYVRALESAPPLQWRGACVFTVYRRVGCGKPFRVRGSVLPGPPLLGTRSRSRSARGGPLFNSKSRRPRGGAQEALQPRRGDKVCGKNRGVGLGDH